MYRLQKLHPPFGSPEAPVIESSYSEGLIEVVDGKCAVNLVETRDRLLKLGYEELPEESMSDPAPKPKKRR